MMGMSPKTEALLAVWGWSPGRSVDISEYENVLLSDGYTLSAAVKAFLREFGGLQVQFPHPRFKHPTWFHFDAVEAAGSLYKEDVDDYTQTIGEPDLAPIGKLDSNVILLMSPTGTMYGVFDDIIMKYGQSGYEGLDCLCFERRAIRLFE